jgi:transketolase
MNDIPMRQGFGRALASYGAENERLVVLDVDTSSSTLSRYFAETYPERFFNIGIAEPCMIDVAVGLALGGLIPVANGFAALLALRALEQVRTCVGYARTNVKIAAGYAGLSDYKDGPTHHAITDLAVIRALPELTVIAPADAQEAGRWVPIIAEHDGPVYIRLSRAAALPAHNEHLPLEIGKGLTLREGDDVALVATGAMVGRCLQAVDRLAEQGIGARLLEIHTLKPLDRELILQAAEETRAVITVEEHSIIGGLGGAVAETLCGTSGAAFARVGIEDAYTRTAPTPEELMDAYGLSVSDIVSVAVQTLERKLSFTVE